MARREVRLPALTTTMEDAELVGWRVEVGDEVREGQPLGEVVTDKVDMELECPVDGTVSELLVDAGSVVQVGAVVAVIDSASEDLLGGLDLDDESQAEPAEASTSETGSRNGDAPAPRVAAPPPVRIRARDAGVDLEDVPATGRRGQVTTEDLRRYIEAREEATKTPAPAGGVERRAPTGDVERPAPTGDVERKRAALRAATARVVTRSAAIPQFTLHRALDLSRAVQRKDGRSWTTEIVRALAAALREHPLLNGRWNADEQRVDTSDVVRIGLAVDVPAGLLVVGVDDPDLITPTHADEHVKQAADRARAGDLQPKDVEGITFTVSNLGGLGVDAFDALLMPPQAGILSVGRVAERPVVVDGRVRTRLQVDVGLTVDHRVADGADGARLLQTFAENLEGEGERSEPVGGEQRGEGERSEPVGGEQKGE
jgi:pyruvate dehydrogenase E2 component (dihydrolipoamide acetyltransferase)